MNSLWRQTGGIWPLGVSCSLTWLDLGAIAYTLEFAHIRAVLEIGVEHGGLAAYLSAYCRATGNCTYLGIDITLNALAPFVRETIGPMILQRDAWNIHTIDEIASWLQIAPSPALIIIDGGNKPKELRLYAPLLRPGDIMIGHDYRNEYGDAEIADVPAKQLHFGWLDDTLLCMFVRKE